MALPSLKNLFSQVSTLFQAESTDKTAGSAKTSWWQSFLQDSPPKLNPEQANQLWRNVSSNIKGKAPAYDMQDRLRKSPPIPSRVDFTALNCRTEKDLAIANYMAMAAKSGIGSPSAQKQFAEMMVKKYGAELKINEQDIDDAKVKKEANGKDYYHILTATEKDELRAFRENYVVQGGLLKPNIHPTVNPKGVGAGNSNTTINTKNKADKAASEQSEMRRLTEQAQVLTTIFGVPTKLTDLKHFEVKEISVEGYGREDNALASLIEKKYGGGNLWADKKAEIRQIAKTNGVKVENLQSNGDGTVGFDLSVENVLKLQHAYIGVQEKFNIDEAKVQNIIDKQPANQFCKGVLDGAWEDLKANWQMVTNPWQTVKDVASGAYELGKIGVQLAVLPEFERNALFTRLADAGIKGLAEMPVSEAAYKLGKLVGAGAVEFALGKGVGVALEAIKGTALGAKLIKTAIEAGREIKQTIGNVPLPTGVKVVEIATTTGEKLRFPTLETAKLGDITTLMMSKAEKVFSSSGKLIDEAIVTAAKAKVANLVKNGDAQELKAFLKETYQKHGYQLYNELKTTVAETIEETYGVRKTIDLDEILGGHALEKHVGKSDDWLRKRLLNETSNVKAASTFRNKEIANRTVAQFVKENRTEIEAWLKNPHGDFRLEKEVTMNESIGSVLKRGKGGAPNSKSFETSKAWIAIVKDSHSVQGWRVETAFPIPQGAFKY